MEGSAGCVFPEGPEPGRKNLLHYLRKCLTISEGKIGILFSVLCGLDQAPVKWKNETQIRSLELPSKHGKIVFL